MRRRCTRCCAIDLQHVEATSSEPGSERVLILSDCRSAAEVVEGVRRQGRAEGAVGRRAGAVAEAVATVCARLGSVDVLWVPGHCGVACNEYADMIATAYLQSAQPIEDATAAVHVCGGDIAVLCDAQQE